MGTGSGKEGRTPQRKKLKVYGYPVSGDTVLRRFGSWKKALLKAHNSITEQAAADESVPAETRGGRHQRRPLPLRKRFFVMKRDHFACARCGASGHGVRLEVGHRVAVARGGSDDLDNLETLCFECNRGQREDLAQ